MYLKPPILRTGKSGSPGRKATRLKGLAIVAGAALAFASVALVAAGPASADPAPQFTLVGSDVTQNVMDAFADLSGDGTLGSYDAVNPLTQVAGENITPAGALSGGEQELCSFSRPNGSGAGFKALDYAWTGGTDGLATGLTSNPQPDCIAMARSSSGAGTVATSGAGSSETTAPYGDFVYIPFAIDAVTWATGPATSTSETTDCESATTGCTNGSVTFSAQTNISQDLHFSQAQLSTLYGTCSPVTVGSTSYNPVGASYAFTSTAASPAVFTVTTSGFTGFTAGQLVTLGGTLSGGFLAGTSYYVVDPAGDTFELAATTGGTPINATNSTAGSGTVDTPGTIDLYVPQNGSGTLSFWETSMGVTAVQPCWHQTVIAGPAVGEATEQDDGTALASDPNGVMPLSIAHWIGLNSGVDVPDVRHGDVLQSISVGITFSATDASPAVFTDTEAAASSFTAGTEVTLTGSSLPGGFTTGTDYFVVSPSGDTFELAATSGGTAIASTSAGTGTANIAVSPQNAAGTMNVKGCLIGTTGTTPNFNQSACFPITREVFNVANYYQVENVTPAIQTTPTATPNAPAYSFTATDANPAVFTATGTAYANGQLVTLNGSSLPGGFAAGTDYYTCNVSTDTFELCTTPEPGTLSPTSAPLASSSAGTGGVSDNAAYSPVLSGLIAGTSSSLCNNPFAIGEYGFGVIPSSNSAFTDACGSTTTSLRVQMNSTAAAG